MFDKMRDAVFGAFLLPLVVAGSVGSVPGRHNERGIDSRPLSNDDTTFLFLHRFPQSASLNEVLSPSVKRRQFAILVFKPSGDETEFHCMHSVRVSALFSTYHRSKGTRSDIVSGW